MDGGGVFVPHVEECFSDGGVDQVVSGAVGGSNGEIGDGDEETVGGHGEVGGL